MGHTAATKKRGGRKRLTETCPQLVENFLQVLRDHTAGDPMRADVKWTNLSRRQISRRLKTRGTPRRKKRRVAPAVGTRISSSQTAEKTNHGTARRPQRPVRKDRPEHRAFPHVTRACKGVPLESIETAKHDIEKTETAAGLNVVVRIIDKVYETGRKYAEDFKKMMTIKFDKHLPKWNDTAIPETT